MKITFDPEVDILRVVLREAPVEESDEDKPGIILDYDGEGKIVGLEVLDASKQKINARSIEYVITDNSASTSK